MFAVESTSLPLDQQISILIQQVGQVRAALLAAQDALPAGTFSQLANVESTLYELNRLASQIEDERANLLGLNDISQVINSSLGLDDVLRIVMDTIVRLTGAERGFLMLRGEQGEMVTRVARNWEKESIGPSEHQVSRSVIQRMIEDGRPILTTNAKEDPRFDKQESVVEHNLRSILCVPLKLKHELVGVIYADNRMRSGLFTEIQRDLLVVFANQAAVAIENARLIASLRSTLAEVTGLKGLMDNIFASIASGVITADVRDKVVLCNQAAEAVLGLKAGELIGQRLADVVPQLAKTILPGLDKVRLTDKTITGLDVSYPHPAGGNVDLRLSLSPLKDADQTTQGIAIVIDDLTEKKRLEGQRRLFERMVSPAVIDQLDPDSLQLGGRRSDITILFADIRGFTGFSERHSPEGLVKVINRYLAAAAEAVLAQEGTVDKFLGDAVMAWFNAPIPQPDHTLRAVRAALAIRQAIARLYSEMEADAHLSFGIGIHYGEALLGLIGTERRLEYTAIGDSVNIAKRLQEYAKPNQIVISAAAYARVRKNVLVDPLEPLLIDGKSVPVEIYEVKGLWI